MDGASIERKGEKAKREYGKDGMNGTNGKGLKPI
jgi:hypothetical protein